ncbi:MAG: GAF domain-containing protein [Anaerolineales bacterium]
MFKLPNSTKEAVALDFEEQEYTDFILRLRRDYLQTMLRGTLWLLAGLMPIMLLLLLSVDPLTLSAFWIFIPFTGVMIFVALAYIYLNQRRSYNTAAHLYVVGLLTFMFLSVLMAPRNWPLRNVLPYVLTLVASAAGLLLPRRGALRMTGLGMLLLLPFLLSFPANVLPPALVMAGLASLIASNTAGSLYVMAQYSTMSYLRARKRADDFFRNKEQLSKTLKERDWLNEQLQTTNRALAASIEVGHQITSLLNIDTLLPRVVDLIQTSFDYYFVGIWTPNEDETALALRVGARKGDEALDLRIPLDAPSVIGDVYRMGVHRRENNVHQVSDFLHLRDLPATQAMIALPLLVGTQTIGVLDIQSKVVGAFEPEDAEVMQALANQIAIAIRNAELYASEQYRRQLAESLEQTGRELASSLDLREVPARILDQLHKVMPYGRGSVLIQRGDVLKSVAQRGFPASYQHTGVTVTLRGGDVYEQISRSHEPLLIADTRRDPRFQQAAGLETHRSWMGIPLITQDRVIGMISLTRREVNAFTPEDAQLVLAFSGQAAIALENASLYDEMELRVRVRTEELNQAYKTLEKMDQNKSDFIRVAAHELRTPLTVIKGYTQVLEAMATEQRQELASLVRGILSGTDRLHRIVNSMLDVAMLDSETMNMVKRPMDLERLFIDVERAFHEAWEERHLELTITGIAALPKIDGDPSLLYKVFDHLVGNAIKYTPDGGQITVIGALIQDGREEPVVKIAVQDTGIGIDPEYHDLIFQKFYQMGQVQLHSSSRTDFKGGGPGLGLAIARGIIEAHGGRIWVESPGHDETTCPGSTFYVLLPTGACD